MEKISEGKRGGEKEGQERIEGRGGERVWGKGRGVEKKGKEKKGAEERGDRICTSANDHLSNP